MRVLHFIGDALVIARVIAMAWLRWRLTWVDECNSEYA